MFVSLSAPENTRCGKSEKDYGQNLAVVAVAVVAVVVAARAVTEVGVSRVTSLRSKINKLNSMALHCDRATTSKMPCKKLLESCHKQHKETAQPFEPETLQASHLLHVRVVGIIEKFETVED